MLIMLGVDKFVSSDTLLNLLPSFGIGVLLRALTLGVMDNMGKADTLQRHEISFFMRYFGSASSLIIPKAILQHIMRGGTASS